MAQVAQLPSELLFDLVTADETSDAHMIELAGFPPDEAATLDKFQQRQSLAPELFLGAFLSGSGKRKLIAYVCSTLASSKSITHESMSEHDLEGTSVCIHAVCVAPEHRRKGVALALLKEYLKRLEISKKYTQALLLTHDNMRGLYEKAGFDWLGPSAIIHGSKPWFEMRKSFGTLPDTPLDLPAGLWEALQQTKRIRPATRLLSTFSSIDEVSEVSFESREEVKTNKFDLLCPREGCGSVILKDGVGRFVQEIVSELETPGQASELILASLPSPSIKAGCWHVRPSPMAFENIGFSKDLPSVLSEGRRKKFMSCADCDLGPLGWTYQGGGDFWLLCSRVGYRA